MKLYAVFDFKPSIRTAIPLISSLDPLFAVDFHVTVYEPVLSCDNRKPSDEVVDKILVG